MSATGYCGFSKVYDRLMADYPYSAILHFIEKTISPAGKKGLDLCSGTGTVAVALAVSGATMTAVDIEPEMLSVARDKAVAAAQKIRFVEADVNRLPDMQPFDFIVSTCDGLNYVKNISSFAKTLAKLLKAGGQAVLEFSSRYKAEHILADNLFYEDAEDVVWFFRNTYEKLHDSVLQELTIFRKCADGNFSRSDDVARQYFYEAEEIATALSEAGFCDVGLLDTVTFQPAKEGAERLTIVATKRI